LRWLSLNLITPHLRSTAVSAGQQTAQGNAQYLEEEGVSEQPVEEVRQLDPPA
jgi:hypothetical protein